VYDTHFAAFGSIHAGDIVPYSFVDGSVQPLKKSIDLGVLYALSTIRGGEIAAEDF
jgi:hypothetical protein